MQFKAEVVKLVTVKFELSLTECGMLAELVTLGREKLNNTANPSDTFAYRFLAGINEALEDDD